MTWVNRRIGHLVNHLRLAQLLLRALAVVGRQGLSIEKHGSLRGRQQTGDHPCRGALAAAGFADHGDGLAAVDVEGNILEDQLLAVTGRYMLDPQQGNRFGRRWFRRLLEGTHGPQGFRIVLLGVRQHDAGIGFLDHLAIAQDDDLVGHLGDHRQIMGDIDGGRVELLDDVADGRQHLDLGSHVERRRRLIENDQVGPAGQGHGGHGALQLPARYLVRIPESDDVGERHLEPGEQIDGVGVGLGLGGYAMLDGNFGKLVDQTVRRIERGGGALRHIGDAHATQ